MHHIRWGSKLKKKQRLNHSAHILLKKNKFSTFPRLVTCKGLRKFQMRYKTKKEKPHSVHCSAKKKRNQSSGEGQQTRRRRKKKKGRRRSNRRCQCGGNLLHQGLFKSCISSIFPFSFYTGRISLFWPKYLLYSGMAGIVRYRPVS